MIFKKKSIALVMFFCVLCHLIALLQFQLKLNTIEFGLRWAGQFRLLLGFSFFLSLLICVVENRMLSLFLILLHSFVFIIIGYPLSGYIGIELTLITVLLAEISVCFRIRNGATAGGLLIVVTLLFQKPINAWNEILPGVVIHDLVSLGLYSLIILILSLSANHYSTKFFSQKTVSTRLNETIMMLTSANLGFQEHAVLVEEQSKDDERKRLTREIHDTVGYTLTNVIMMIEAATDLATGNPVKLKDLLRKTRSQVQEGLNETRRALRMLRSVEVEKLKGLKAIHGLLKSFETVTGVRINVEFGNVPWILGQPYDQIIYRFVQEGLTNAFRHGKATEIKIRFWQDDSAVTLHIHDNGMGCNEIEEGIGLAGMRERFERLGGRILAHSVTDGFELSARLPVLINSR